DVVIPERAIITTGLHATLFETGGPNGTGMDRSCPPSQKVPCRREPAARHASRGLRSGNPRRRLLVGSKGVERLEIRPMLGHRTSRLRSRKKPSGVGKAAPASRIGLKRR